VPRLRRVGLGLAAALVAVPGAAAAALPKHPPRIDGSRVELVVRLSAPSLSQFARRQPSLQGFAGAGRRVSATDRKSVV